MIKSITINNTNIQLDMYSAGQMNFLGFSIFNYGLLFQTKTEQLILFYPMWIDILSVTLLNLKRF